MNYYTRLGVPSTATDKEIQLAYRRLVKQHHPDGMQQEPLHIRRQSEELLKQINIAYDILSDHKKRHQYDLSHRRQSQPKRTHTYSSTGSQKNSANHGRARAYAGQDIFWARREYLHLKQELNRMNRLIWEWYSTLLRKTAVVGFGVGLGTVIQIVVIMQLIRVAQLPMSGWLLFFLFLNLLILQIGAILVVMEQISIAPPRSNRLTFAAFASAIIVLSFIIITVAASGFYSIGTTPLEVFLFSFSTHLLSCASFSFDWVSPLLIERRQIESKLIRAEEVMTYYKKSGSNSW